MNKGIEILLARMESNPDEFMGVNNKWSNLIESHEDYMTDEDRKALFGKLHALRMDRFTEHVMKKLLEEKEDFYAKSLAASMAQTQAQMNRAMAQQLYNTAQTQAATVPTSAYEHSTVTLSDIPFNQNATQLQLGKQTLTEKTLKKLKALIK